MKFMEVSRNSRGTLRGGTFVRRNKSTQKCAVLLAAQEGIVKGGFAGENLLRLFIALKKVSAKLLIPLESAGGARKNGEHTSI